MVRPGSMPRTIKQMDSKAERRRERQKLGKLSEQRITGSTKERYEIALAAAAHFAHVSPTELLRMPGLDEILSSYLEHLWEDGESRTMASYSLAAVQFHRPSLRGQLRQSWQLLSLWNKLEQPRRATPLDPQMLMAFAGVLAKWRWVDLSHLCIVGFCGLLRTGCAGIKSFYHAKRVNRLFSFCRIQKLHNGIC